MSVRVYRYGLLPPTKEADLVRSQMRAAHNYRNVLTEIERGRRAALREIDTSHAESAALAAAVRETREAEDKAVRELRATRAKTRSRSETEAQREAVKAARLAKREAVRAFAEQRKRLREDATVEAARDAINERAAELRRSAREHCGVHWGSYLIVEDAMQAAAKAPLYDGDEPNDPRFVHWASEGHVGVQLQGGLDVADVWAHRGDTQLQIEPVNEAAWHSEVRGERRRLSRTTLRMRVQSDGRQPVWAEWPMIMHRPLPDGGQIKRARVSLRKTGPREVWSVDITVQTAAPPVRTCGKGAVGIDLGWRLMPNGLRVAAWRGSDGEAGELVLPLETEALGGIRKAEELRGLRDDKFNAARAGLVEWLRGREVPAWLRQATTTLPMWRSAGRLAALAKRWRSERFEGDEAGYDNLEHWRYRDHHLWSWETSQRAKSLRRRREEYRIFAAMLATRYETIVLEDFDLRDVAAKPKPEKVESENQTARSHRQLAAVSELRLTLINAAGARGAAVAKVDAAYTTRICHACGLVETWDQANVLSHKCSGCEATWDQDANAAVNILERWNAEQKSGGARDTKTSEPKEDRWVKARRMKREKDAAKAALAGAVAT